MQTKNWKQTKELINGKDHQNPAVLELLLAPVKWRLQWNEVKWNEHDNAFCFSYHLVYVLCGRYDNLPNVLVTGVH